MELEGVLMTAPAHIGNRRLAVWMEGRLFYRLSDCLFIKMLNFSNAADSIP